MNFWETEQAGWFAESILQNKDIVCEDPHLYAYYLFEYGWTRRRAWNR